MRLDIAGTRELLPLRDNYLLLTHRRPDGDTLGCAAALAMGLRAIGKSAYLLENDEVTERYSSLVTGLYAPTDFCPDAVIAVDIASTDLLPDNARAYAENVWLCVDHHPSNTGYAENLCLYAERAACGEVIYELLIALSGGIDAAIADALYIAVSTDTGCFSFDNTNANTFSVAARLVEAGARMGEINRALFRSKTRGRIAVEGMIYSEMEYLHGGRAVIVALTNAMIDEVGATEDDLDNISAIPLSIEGVDVGVTIRETSATNECKVSVRSSPSVSANAICGRFGGGGHAQAAGFSITATVAEVRERIIALLDEILGGNEVAQK
ncbi:MAG: DHH family phosphoesterase [Oscillospiraceae bacterium]|jgi:phosphoesterase RecJ-like protein|nr:DHH family phosphoesterase [Oscillospiraceae bacterium]